MMLRGRKPKFLRNTLRKHPFLSLSSSLPKDTPKNLILLTNITNYLLVATIGGFVLIFITLAIFSRDLPNPNQLLERSYELSTKLYDRNGEMIYEVYGEKNRTLVSLDGINPDVSHATLATEDSNFYQHQGFSIWGMFRAFRNTLTGEGLQGGSTITQQVIKNTLLTQDRTVSRKIKEFILSLQLEGRYTKDEILQMYLNESPYGGQNYGVYSAAKAYFNKNPKDLTLAESAYIAGLTQSPSIYSPYSLNPQAGLDRKNYVLYLMKERGWLGEDGQRYYISNEEYEAAKSEELKFEAARVAFEAPHFIFYVRDILTEMYGEDVMEQGGLQVTTSLDLEIQAMTEDIVLTEIEKAKSENVYNGAMVVLDAKTSQILAMVGSKDYNLDPQPEGCVSGQAGETGCKFDPYVNVTTSLRQPGSAIKPITYATMLTQGYTTASPFLDVQTVFKGSAPDKPYIPENYDGIFRGPMSLRKSLGNSLNIPAVKALKIVGLDSMIDMAESMGITTFKDRSRYGLALTLGGGETQLLELTGAFNTFAAKGVYRRPTPIVEIKNSKGEVLYSWKDAGKKTISEDVAFLISDILSDDGARSAVFGSGSLLKIPNHEVAVKTGTTDDKRDNYAIGFTPEVTAGVWVGNNNNEAMNPYIASGISGATPIYSSFFKKYFVYKEEKAKEKSEEYKAEEFEAPKNVKKVTVDELTGMLPQDNQPTKTEWFIEGTEPTAKSDWYLTLEVCKDDGNIANDSCKDADRSDRKDFIKIQAELPEWQSSVDAYLKEKYSGEDKYFPPSIKTVLEFDGGSVDNKDDVYVKIVGLEDGNQVPLRFRLNAEVSCYNDVDEVKIYMDDKQITSDGSKPYGYNFELSASDIGKHKFKVVAEDEKGNDDSDELELEVIGYQLD